MFLYRLAARLAYLIVETLWRTARLRFVNLDRLTTLVREQGAVVPVFWHQHLLMCARFIADRRAELKTGFMISPSVDGQAPTMLAELYGAHVVRGSGSYTGMRAVRGVYTAIVKEGISPGITPDGPRGPRFKFKPGALLLAQMSGRPILPMSYAASRAWLIKWDRFVIPMPGARIALAIGAPRYVPRVTDAASLERLQGEMERELKSLYGVARAALQSR
jgi:lysophospholipid acyltransferase (LPLAT)-like uncharacterized protein